MPSKIADVFVSMRGDSSRLAADLAKAKAQVNSQFAGTRSAIAGIGRGILSFAGVVPAFFAPSAAGMAAAMKDRVMGTALAARGAGNIISGVFRRQVPQAFITARNQAATTLAQITSPGAVASRMASAVAASRAASQQALAAGLTKAQAAAAGGNAFAGVMRAENQKITDARSALTAAERNLRAASGAWMGRIRTGAAQMFGGLIQGASGWARMWAGTLGSAVRVATGAFGQIRALGNQLGGGMIANAAPLIAVGTLGTSIKFFADFQYEMTRVAAVTNATDAQFQKLTAHARQLGRDTIFTATQAADAMGNLATAGFSVNEIHQAMPDTLNLAAAGGLNVADAALYMARVIRAQKLPATESGRVADVLTLGFHRSATDLPSLAEAFRAVGPITRQAGMEIEETTGILMAFANAGITGGSAGNNLKRIMQRFVGEPAMVRKAFKELGIEIADSEGKMRPMADIIDDLNASMVGLTDVEKANRIGKISGLYAQSALQELLTVGGDAIRQNADLVREEGAAAAFAERRINTLKGAFLIMLSAIQDVQIALGTVLEKSFVGFFQGVIRNMNATSAWIEKNKELVVQIFQVSSAITGSLIGWSLLGAAVTVVFGPMGLVIGGITAVVLALRNMTVGQRENMGVMASFRTILSVFGQFFRSVFNSMRPLLETIGAGILNFFSNFAAWLERNRETISQWGAVLGEIFNNIIVGIGQVLEWVGRLIGGMLGIDGTEASWDNFAKNILSALDELTIWTADFQRTWDVMVAHIQISFLHMLSQIKLAASEITGLIFTGGGGAGNAVLGALNPITPKNPNVPLTPEQQQINALNQYVLRSRAQMQAIRDAQRVRDLARQLNVQAMLPDLVGDFDPDAPIAAIAAEMLRLQQIQKQQQLAAAQAANAQIQQLQQQNLPAAANILGGAAMAGVFAQQQQQAANAAQVLGANLMGVGNAFGAAFGQAAAQEAQQPRVLIPNMIEDLTRQLLGPAREAGAAAEAAVPPKEGGVKLEDPKSFWSKIQEGIGGNPRERRMEDHARRQREALEGIWGIMRGGFNNFFGFG